MHFMYEGLAIQECVGELSGIPIVSAKTHSEWHLSQEIDGSKPKEQ